MSGSDSPDAIEERYQLRPGTSSATTGDGTLHLLAWPASLALGRSSEALCALVRRLADVPSTAEELLALTSEHDEGHLIQGVLARLTAHGWLAVTVTRGAAPLYTLLPVRAAAPPQEEPPDLVLSRFAVMVRKDAHLVLQAPLASSELRIHDSAVLALVGALALGSDTAVPLPAEIAAGLRRSLYRCGLAAPAGGDEEGELRSLQWAAHELWFHDSTRSGRLHSGDGYGRTWWADGTFEQPPVIREPFPGPAVGLYRPDLSKVRTTDPPMTAVLEDRRTIREHDDANPLIADQLGELLFRCAGNRSRLFPDGAERTVRPHPSGGALYELEIYPAVRRVAGIDPGLYHYDAGGHRLELVRARAPAIARLLSAAAWSAGGTDPPQVLLVVAARFGRLMWAYQSIGYALILKHVGVLYQSLYMVATAMGLAACALGAGDSDTFAEATGLDPLVEGSVGEFMIGSYPPQRPPEERAP